MRPPTGTSRALALLVSLSLVSGAALAEPPPPQPAASEPPLSADELHRRGNDAMANLKPGEALEDYQQAYALSKDPALLYNMGHALETLEDYPGALAKYQDFARLAPADLRARVPKLDELLANIRAKVATVSISCNVPGARVLVRDRAVGEVPPKGALLVLSLNAGPAAVEVDAEGFNRFRRNLDLPGGGSLVVDADLIPSSRAGVLVVDTEPESGEVLVDDKSLGSAPVEVSVGVGTHTVLVRHAGFEDKSTSVVVNAGERKPLTVKLEKSTPLTQKWWFWAGIGAVVAGGVAIGIAATTERSADRGSIPPGSTSTPLLR